MDHQKDDEKSSRFAMRLRYAEIDPDIIAELPDWSQPEIDRESEKTLKDLGITRQKGESYLLAWVRTMFAENDCEDNPENRQRLIEAIRDDWNAQLFVWVLGGDERKAFGLEDSPAFQEYLVRHHAARSLSPCCFYDQDEPRYWDYQPQAGRRRPARKPVPTNLVARTILGLLVVAVGTWAAKGLSAPVGWRIADVPVLLVWLGLTAAGAGLLLGLSEGRGRIRPIATSCFLGCGPRCFDGYRLAPECFQENGSGFSAAGTLGSPTAG